MHRSDLTGAFALSRLRTITTLAFGVVAPRPATALERSAYTVGSVLGGWLAVNAVRRVIPSPIP